MINEGKIGESEAIAYLVIMIITKIFLAYPMVLVSYAANAAWAVVLISGFIMIVYFFFTAKLVTRFSDLTFPQICEQVLGVYVGFAFALILIVVWALEVALLLRSFSESMLVVALPETPLSIVMVTFLGAAIYAVYLGIKAIARVCYLSFPYVLGALLLITLLSFTRWNSDWLFPLLGSGVLPVIKAGIVRSTDFLEISLIYGLSFLFYPEQVKRIGLKSIFFSIAIFLLVIVTYSLSYPYTVGSEPYLPLYVMARGVYLSSFLQRIEAIFVIFWVFAGLLVISSGFYAFCRVFAEILKLPDYKPLILPVAIIIFALAFIPASLPDTVLLANYALRKWGGAIFFATPILLYLITLVRGGGAKNGTKQNKD